MSFNVIFKNEMMLAARSKRIFVIAAVYNTVMAAFMLLSLNYVSSASQSNGTAPYKYMMPLNIGVMFVTAVLLSLLIIPSAGAAIAGERERQTLDILLSTRLSTFEIISGKILSCVSSAILLLVSGLPMFCVTLIYGGINLADIYKSILYVAFFIVLTGSMGVFCSCVFKTTTSATVASLGILLSFTAGTGLLVVLGTVSLDQSAGTAVSPLTALVWTWLLNPAATFLDIACAQTSSTFFDGCIGEFGVPDFLLPYWTPLSVMVQVLAVIILVILSMRTLDPLKGHHERVDGRGKK